MIILRQREFARKDYEGLTDSQKIELGRKRSDWAKSLKAQWRNSHKAIDNDIKNGYFATRLTGKISGGGVESGWNFVGRKGWGDDNKRYSTRFKGLVTDKLLNKSSVAKQAIRDQVTGKITGPVTL